MSPVMGTVEEVALRYTRLQDPSGVCPEHVRNGEILRRGQPRGWTLAIVDVIAYD